MFCLYLLTVFPILMLHIYWKAVCTLHIQWWVDDDGEFMSFLFLILGSDHTFIVLVHKVTSFTKSFIHQTSSLTLIPNKLTFKVEISQHLLKSGIHVYLWNKFNRKYLNHVMYPLTTHVLSSASYYTWKIHFCIELTSQECNRLISMIEHLWIAWPWSKFIFSPEAIPASWFSSSLHMRILLLHVLRIREMYPMMLRDRLLGQVFGGEREGPPLRAHSEWKPILITFVYGRDQLSGFR